MKRRQSLILIGGVLIPPFAAGSAGLQTGGSPAITIERPLMGTLFKVTCHHEDHNLLAKAVEAAFSEAEKINTCASDYIADSELLSLSKVPAGTAVPISPLLFSLLKQSRHYAEKTDGLFDPTLGPLTKLWRESRRRKVLPDPAVLAAAKAATGWKHLILGEAESTATLALPGMRLDLGAIAKGQAADAMFAVLKNYGISRSCITAGGDVRAGDPPPGEKGWKIGVRTFDKEHDSSTLFLSNEAVSTSGSLQQTIEIAGVRYAHIIDPATGLGLTRPAAATVISPTSATSDALATACCIAPPEQAEKFASNSGARLLLPLRP